MSAEVHENDGRRNLFRKRYVWSNGVVVWLINTTSLHRGVEGSPGSEWVADEARGKGFIECCVWVREGTEIWVKGTVMRDGVLDDDEKEGKDERE